MGPKFKIEITAYNFIIKEIATQEIWAYVPRAAANSEKRAMTIIDVLNLTPNTGD